MSKQLCFIGWHSWEYIENHYGGRPINRRCRCCGKWQMWDYDNARQHGIINWVPGYKESVSPARLIVKPQKLKVAPGDF